MHSLSEWASSQPIWMQVMLGLFAFFVLVPIILGVVFFGVSAILQALNFTIDFATDMIFVRALLTAIALFSVLTGIWLFCAYAAHLTAYQIGDFLSLSPRRLEAVELSLSFIIFLLTVVGVAFGTFRLSPSIRTTIAAWRAELDGDPKD